MSTTNPYCKVLGIKVPCLEAAKNSPDANVYALLIVVALERGEPITLTQVATRFEEAGIATYKQALASLKRCRPGRPPLYRDGDMYALDPYDHEADLWAFRLGLRPPKVAALRVVRSSPIQPSSPDEALSLAELDEVLRDGIPGDWSAQRIAICVLDTHGTPILPDQVLRYVHERGRRSRLSSNSAKYWRRGSPVRVRHDGKWELSVEHEAVRSARRAAHERLAMIHRWADRRPDAVVMEARRKQHERTRLAHGEELARMSRVLIHAFPQQKPAALVLVDVTRRDVSTFFGKEIADARQKVLDYEIIAAIGVRTLLRSLGVDPGMRRLADLAPSQKTRQLNKRGRTLKITTRLLVQGTCGIPHPFGDEKILRKYLREGKLHKLCRRLESDAKALYAFYQYGRLHGTVRLRWGFIDERIPAPWVHPDETTIHRLMDEALHHGIPLEVVVGSAPGWNDPWSRVQRAYVEKEGWHSWIHDESGNVIDESEVQMARLAKNSVNG